MVSESCLTLFSHSQNHAFFFWKKTNRNQLLCCVLLCRAHLVVRYRPAFVYGAVVYTWPTTMPSPEFSRTKSAVHFWFLVPCDAGGQAFAPKDFENIYTTQRREKRLSRKFQMVLNQTPHGTLGHRLSTGVAFPNASRGRRFRNLKQ